MKVQELLESKRPYDAEDYIKMFNSETPYCPARLELGDLGMSKIPLQIVSAKHTIYNFDNNNLSTFENFPEEAKEIRCNKNNFKSLHNIHKFIKNLEPIVGTGRLQFIGNPITSHVLGLLKIKGLHAVALVSASGDKKLRLVESIINNRLPNTRGNDAVFECQQELIDAGFEEYAQL